MARLLVLVALVLLPACQTSYEVERRETPVHVWLTVPAFARSGGVIEGDVRVGPFQVVRGPVTFPGGVPTVALPSLYIRSGAYRVQALMQRGQVRGSNTVVVEGESWIQIVVSGSNASITLHEGQPDSRGNS